MKKGIIPVVIIIALMLLMFVSLNGCNARNNEEIEEGPQLEYNYAWGSLARNRVENAQYLPNIEKLAASDENIREPLNASILNAVSEETSEQTDNISSEYEPAFGGQDLEIDKEGFESIIESLSVIDSRGSGKYMGYNIFEIKEEINFVLESVPAFNQWFRLPNMREEQGYSVTPHYESWAYYLEYDQKTQGVSITRVSLGFSSTYIDFETGSFIEDYSNDETVINYSVMKTNYYYDENNKEVVECFLYSVLIDHVIRGTGKSSYYNPNPEHYHPISFHYLKNVKDTSLTKYNIFVALGYSSKEGSGHDITGRMPHGYTREFIHLDYTDSDNIQMLKVFQSFTAPVTYAFDEPNITDIYFYNKIGDTTQVYLSTHDYLNIPVIESKNLINSYNFISKSLYSKVGTKLSSGSYDIAGYFSFRPKSYVKSFNLDYSGSLRTSEDYNSELVSRCRRNFAGNDYDTVKFHLSRSLVNMAKRLDVNDDWIKSYEEEYGNQLYVSNEGFRYEYMMDNFLLAISKDVIGNSYLKNNWRSIYKGSDEAVKLDEIKQVSSVETGVILNDVTSDISISDSKITYSLSAKVATSVFLEEGKEYSLSLVLYTRDNNYVVIATDYSAKYVEGEEYILTNSGEFLFDSSLLFEENSYNLGYAFTLRNGENDIICSTFNLVYLKSCENFVLEDNNINGFRIEYHTDYSYNVLSIHTRIYDLEPPTIIFKGDNDTLSFRGTAKIGEIFNHFEISDNDQIASIRVMHGDTYYDSFKDTVVAGQHSLVVRDKNHLEKTYEFSIILIEE